MIFLSSCSESTPIADETAQIVEPQEEISIGYTSMRKNDVIGEEKAPIEEKIICNPPYIRFADTCCLDRNSNSICDNDEISIRPNSRICSFSFNTSDKPNVEFFLLALNPDPRHLYVSHALRALGDKIDYEIRFLPYVLHGEREVEEQLRMYCIQKDQKSKFLDYFECQSKTVLSPTVHNCLGTSGIDVSSMNYCIEETKKKYNIAELLSDKSKWYLSNYPYFPIDEEYVQTYNITASPVLVVNGKKIQDLLLSTVQNCPAESRIINGLNYRTHFKNAESGTPESYLKEICLGFEKLPKECDSNLCTTKDMCRQKYFPELNTGGIG